MGIKIQKLLSLPKLSIVLIMIKLKKKVVQYLIDPARLIYDQGKWLQEIGGII